MPLRTPEGEEEEEEEEVEVLDDEDLQFVDDGDAAMDADEAGGGEEDEEEVSDEAAEPQPPIEVPRDDSQLTLRGHSSSVFCVAVSPDGALAASGSEDDTAIVWRLADGAQIMRCHGHGDSVVLVSFNKTGRLLVTGDMRGLLQVWQLPAAEQQQQQQQQQHQQPVWSAEIEELRWGSWHPTIVSALLAVAGDGSLWLWLVPSGECKVLGQQQQQQQQRRGGGGGQCDSACGRVLASDSRLCAIGYADGSVRLFDLRQGAVCSAVKLLNADDEGDGGVVSLDASSSGCLLACGTDSGRLLLLRTTSSSSSSSSTSSSSSSLVVVDSKELASVAGQSDAANWSTEAVQFNSCVGQQQQQLLAAGTVSGWLFVFCPAAGSLRLRHCAASLDASGRPAGIVRICWLADSVRLLAADLRGCLQLWDARTAMPMRRLTGHCDSVLDCCLLPSAAAAVSCGDRLDCTVRVFPID